MTFKIDTDGYVNSLFDNLTFAAYMVVYCVKKHHSIDAFKRSLLPFFCSRQYLVCYAADSGIRHFYPVNVSDMRLDIGSRHPLSIH